MASSNVLDGVRPPIALPFNLRTRAAASTDVSSVGPTVPAARRIACTLAASHDTVAVVCNEESARDVSMHAAVHARGDAIIARAMLRMAPHESRCAVCTMTMRDAQEA